MDLGSFKENLASLRDSLAEGWRHLADSAAGALTRFKAGEKTDLPPGSAIDDRSYLPTQGWSMLGGEVFEDDRRFVVRLEVPGMRKEDLAVEVLGDAVVVSGEKRFVHEGGDGRWRTMQCAYGSFRRSVPLPGAVTPDQADATYRDGVLRIELPKRNPGTPKAHTVPVR